MTNTVRYQIKSIKNFGETNFRAIRPYSRKMLVLQVFPGGLHHQVSRATPWVSRRQLRIDS